LKSPCTTSYRSSIEIIAVNWLDVFENRVFLHFATDRQTDERMDSTDALSRFRCCERRLKNCAFLVSVRTSNFHKNFN